MGYMLYVAAILAFPFPSWFPRSHLVGFSISLSDPTQEVAVLYAQEKANKRFAFSVFFNVGCTIQATGALASWPRLQYTTPLKAHVGPLSRSSHIRHTVGQNMYQTTSMRYSVCIEKKDEHCDTPVTDRTQDQRKTTTTMKRAGMRGKVNSCKRFKEAIEIARKLLA